MSRDRVLNVGKASVVVQGTACHIMSYHIHEFLYGLVSICFYKHVMSLFFVKNTAIKLSKGGWVA